MNIIIVHGEKPLSSGEIHPEFIRRLNQALEISKNAEIDLIIISGGQTRKNAKPEAEMGFDYLSPKTKTPILLEIKSKTTFENIIFTKNLLENREIDLAYIVSSKKRMFRIKYLYKLSWPQIFLKVRFIEVEDEYPSLFYLVELFYFFFAILDREEKFFAKFSKIIFRNG
jgi:hypothetical protein